MNNETVVRNSFFLWVNTLILLLTAIPIVSHLASLVFHMTEYTVPKAYELKMYALAMGACLLPLLAKYQFAHAALEGEHVWYQRYLLVFFPLAAVLYSLPLAELWRYSCVFTLALVGLGLFYVDLRRSVRGNNNVMTRYYPHLLLASVVISIAVIVFASVKDNFQVFSYWNLIPLFLAMAILWLANVQSKVNFFLVMAFIFFVTFFTSGNVDVLHYGFFLGPVAEVLYGHFHPFMIDVQYGTGLTAFLVLYYKLMGAVTLEGMQILLKVLTFIQYLLIFVIASALYRSKKIAFLALLAVLIFNFYSQADDYYTCPSTGFLRFGFVYLLLGCYVLEGKWLSKRTVLFATAMIGSVAVLWSLESAVYTLPALLFAEYGNKNLRKFLPVFLACFSVLVIAYLAPLYLSGQPPLLQRYFEYATVYANGLGQIPLDRATSIWWLFPLLYGFFLIRIFSGTLNNKMVSMLTVYGIALFTYFAGRADPNNIFHVSIPFVLLSIYLIVTLESPARFVKNLLLVLFFVGIASSNEHWVSDELIVKNMIERNVPRTESSLSTLALSHQLSAATDTVKEADCSAFLPLEKYVQHGELTLLTEDEHFYRFYTCTHTHNTLSLNPFTEVVLNPHAVKRVLEKARLHPMQYILVDSLLLTGNDVVNSGMTPILLQQLHARKVAEITFDKQAIHAHWLKTDHGTPGKTTLVVFQTMLR